MIRYNTNEEIKLAEETDLRACSEEQEMSHHIPPELPATQPTRVDDMARLQPLQEKLCGDIENLRQTYM